MRHDSEHCSPDTLLQVFCERLLQSSVRVLGMAGTQKVTIPSQYVQLAHLHTSPTCDSEKEVCGEAYIITARQGAYKRGHDASFRGGIKERHCKRVGPVLCIFTQRAASRPFSSFCIESGMALPCVSSSPAH